MNFGSVGSKIVSDPQFNPHRQIRVFDDFLGVTNEGADKVAGTFMFCTQNNGGGVVASATTGVAQNRIGLFGCGIGTTSNSTGNGTVFADSARVYGGQGEITLQWSIQTPSALSSASNEYCMEMGLINVVSGSTSTSAMAIQYLRTTSTNWSFYTANNGTANTTTTADSTNFAVTAAAWWDFKIYLNSAGTQVDFYGAPSGSPLVLLGSGTTLIPDSTHSSYIGFNIYKLSSQTAQRAFTLDWLQLDMNLNR